jgi:adenylate kinase
MNRGELVSDEIVAGIIRERIFSPECRRGYVLDGFPRNLAQALILEKIENSRPETAFEVLIDEPTLVARLTSRRVCLRCQTIFNLKTHPPKKEGICDACQGKLIQREDDSPEVIRERLRIYHEQTEPLRAYYQKKSVYHGLDGSGTVGTVFAALSSVIDQELIGSGWDRSGS